MRDTFPVKRENFGNVSDKEFGYKRCASGNRLEFHYINVFDGYIPFSIRDTPFQSNV